jgi:hypothetical protein
LPAVAGGLDILPAGLELLFVNLLGLWFIEGSFSTEVGGMGHLCGTPCVRSGLDIVAAQPNRRS